MSNPQHVNTVEAKNRLNELIAKAVDTQEPIVIEKRGEPIAVVLDYKTYQKTQNASFKQSKKGKRDSFLEELKSFHRHLKKKYPKGTGDSVEILREIRERRMQK